MFVSVSLCQYLNYVSFLSSGFHTFLVEVVSNSYLWSSVSTWHFFFFFLKGYLQNLLLIFGFKQLEYVFNTVLFLFVFGIYCAWISLHTLYPFLVVDCYFFPSVLASMVLGWGTPVNRGRSLFPWSRFRTRHCMPVSLKLCCTLPCVLHVVDRQCHVSLVPLKENVLLSSKGRRPPILLIDLLPPEPAPPPEVGLTFLFLFTQPQWFSTWQQILFPLPKQPNLFVQ